MAESSASSEIFVYSFVVWARYIGFAMQMPSIPSLLTTLMSLPPYCTFLLFGMIAANGLRILVDNKIDFEKKRVSLSIRALLEQESSIDAEDLIEAEEADEADAEYIEAAEETVAAAIVEEAQAAPAEPAEEAAEVFEAPAE